MVWAAVYARVYSSKLAEQRPAYLSPAEFRKRCACEAVECAHEAVETLREPEAFEHAARSMWDDMT